MIRSLSKTQTARQKAMSLASEYDTDTLKYDVDSDNHYEMHGDDKKDVYRDDDHDDFFGILGSGCSVTGCSDPTLRTIKVVS